MIYGCLDWVDNAAKGFAVGAENADGVNFGLPKLAGKCADIGSENSDKKCSICSKKVMRD